MPDNKDFYISPLSTRYASDEMQHIFSENFKFRTWRRLWIALAKSEKELGLNITDEQIAELEGARGRYKLRRRRGARKRGSPRRHVARLRITACSAPRRRPIIHLGATTCYVGDNTDVIIHDARASGMLL